MKFNLFWLLVLISTAIFGQSNNISGTWVGSARFIKSHIQTKYDLTQAENQISGTIESITDSANYITYTVEGSIEGDQVVLTPVSYSEKKGMACMSVSFLTYKINNGNPTLIGKWKGDKRFDTCPPLVSGAVTIVRTEESATSNAVADNREIISTKETHEIAENDIEGNALISELSKRNFYGLIIGINEYNDPEIQDLDNPIKDAEALATVLQQHYSFEKQNLKIISNATREDIIMALDVLVDKVDEKDNVLIFYAGHGIWNNKLDQGYWLPSDASADSKSYWLSNSTLRDYIGGIKSKHTLLISDACFSGGILKERGVFENSKAILEVYKLPSRKAMTSGTLKTVPDESVFIKYLLKNLKNNQAPLISADQLFRNFKTAVINNSPNGQVPQYGPISQAGDEGGDFVFLRRD